MADAIPVEALPAFLTSALLDGVPGVRHGFFTRHGGVSAGPYWSLNCGLRPDDAVNALNNRELAMGALGLSGCALVTGRQYHGTEVAIVEEPWVPGKSPEVDGLATVRPGIALGIPTADCAPVLFVDPDARVIGAAHAGWKGALAGILASTVTAMARLGAKPSNIVAAIGPCIAQPSYEVGPEFRAAFLGESRANDNFFVASDRTGRFKFDLPRYVERRLLALGLARVEWLGCDTAADGNRFFSCRRSALAGEARFGLNLSAVALDA